MGIEILWVVIPALTGSALRAFLGWDAIRNKKNKRVKWDWITFLQTSSFGFIAALGIGLSLGGNPANWQSVISLFLASAGVSSLQSKTAVSLKRKK